MSQSELHDWGHSPFRQGIASLAIRQCLVYSHELRSARAAGRGAKQQRNSADLAPNGESVVCEFFNNGGGLLEFSPRDCSVERSAPEMA